MPILLFCILMLALAPSARGQAQPSSPDTLGKGVVLERPLGPSDSNDFTVRLDSGMSVLLSVQQLGIDLVVEVRAPDGTLLQAVDSPTGRTGDERVEIFADRSGAYGVRVRPYDSGEPQGRYRLTVVELRDAQVTATLLAARARERDAAAAWLRRRAARLPDEIVRSLPPLDELADHARIIALGEATHGSREISDLRFAVTRYLVQRHRVRLIAIEYSTSRLAVLNTWALGGAVKDADVQRALNSGWIGRRTLGDLVRWLREWNAEHPADRVRLVGVDPQDNERARAELLAVVSAAYGDSGIAGVDSAIHEIAVADSQAWVFGDSRVSAATYRTLVEVAARLDSDAPLLVRQLGTESVDAARDAARQFVQFADFNAEGRSIRSRDWYMAANLMRALDAAPAGTRAVFWAHNAHASLAPDRAPQARTSGAFLRAALGCDYRALATSFGEGAFVAQLPNDPQDRLEVSSLPPAPPETIDGVMGSVYGAGAVAAWACDPRPRDVPPWLQRAQSLHWVGGIFEPGSLSSEAFRPFKLVDDFDGIFYLPKVTADQIFSDRPVVPARSR
ncbi:MAG TPA: erythromycin esterase family protein [Gemmatimonadaceae bacterium]|nr:erythromycin esterase family protein [Gemmatimonadaceae bacterium]